MHRKDFTLKKPMDDQVVQVERFLADVALTGLRSASGTYAGDGTTSKTVVVGFTPKFLVIARMVALSATFPVSEEMAFWLYTNPAITYLPVTGFVDNAVTGYTKDGVSLGVSTAVNESGVSYTFLAIG